MEHADLKEHFALLGVEPAAVSVYRELLAKGSLTLADLVARGDMPATAQRCLDALMDVGLIAAAGADQTEGTDRFVPVPPDAGLRMLGSRKEGELNEAVVAIQNAYREFSRQTGRASLDHLVEVVTGPAILQRIKQAEDHAQREIRRLDSPPYYRTQSSNRTELDHLARGVGYRVVYAQASLARENYLETNIVPCIKAGEQARVLGAVPVKLSVIDDTVALVSLSITDADVNRTLLIVRPSTLFSALVGLFEMCWQSSLSILPTGAVSSRIEPVEERMLGLLSAGMSDDDIVRTLRVSRRTFFRYLEKLQTRAGVSTRFQLGVYAAQQGWLEELPRQIR
ncbi:transcriptional regulator TrmB [Jatrophihabitans sp. DSM 45814]